MKIDTKGDSFRGRHFVAKYTKMNQNPTKFNTIKKGAIMENEFKKPFHFSQRFTVAKIFNNTFAGAGFRSFERYSSTPQIKRESFFVFNGRLLIDFDDFFDDFERIFRDEYESEKSIEETIVNHFGVDAFKLIFALTYTGDDNDFARDMNENLKQINHKS